MKQATLSLSRRALVKLASLRLAIVLLLLVSAAATIGTVLPQDQGPGVISHSHFWGPAKAVLMALQAYDVYHAVWFQALLASLFVNLAACTKLRFPATWRRLRERQPRAPKAAGLPGSQPLVAAPDPAFLALARERGYRLRPTGDGGYFAERGKLARWAPTVIHLALFVVIGGTITSGLMSWKGLVKLMPGQAISSGAMYQQATHGRLSRPPADFKLLLTSFRIDSSASNRVKQYYAGLRVQAPAGTPLLDALIHVNLPLGYAGVTVYQSTWGLAAATVKLAGVRLDLPLEQTAVGYVSRPLPLLGEGHVLFVKALGDPTYVVSTRTLAVDGELLPGQATTISGSPLELVQYQLFSGLQVKADPGIPWVYLGSALLLVGLGLVPFSHREVWLRQELGTWWLAGRASKGKVLLARDLERLASDWAALKTRPANTLALPISPPPPPPDMEQAS